MPAANTPAADKDSRGGPSTECPILLQTATPDVFLRNPFRITGVAVDVTARDITKHLAQRKLRAELGEVEDVRTSQFAREPPPTIEEIRAAEQRLRIPEQRIVDE